MADWIDSASHIYKMYKTVFFVFITSRLFVKYEIIWFSWDTLYQYVFENNDYRWIHGSSKTPLNQKQQRLMQVYARYDLSEVSIQSILFLTLEHFEQLNTSHCEKSCNNIYKKEHCLTPIPFQTFPTIPSRRTLSSSRSYTL